MPTRTESLRRKDTVELGDLKKQCRTSPVQQQIRARDHILTNSWPSSRFAPSHVAQYMRRQVGDNAREPLDMQIALCILEVKRRFRIHYGLANHMPTTLFPNLGRSCPTIPKSALRDASAYKIENP